MYYVRRILNKLVPDFSHQEQVWAWLYNPMLSMNFIECERRDCMGAEWVILRWERMPEAYRKSNAPLGEWILQHGTVASQDICKQHPSPYHHWFYIKRNKLALKQSRVLCFSKKEFRT